MFHNLAFLSFARDKFNGGRTRFFLKFIEKKEPSKILEWTPRWDDVRKIMVEAVEVEKINLPGSTYLDQFAELCTQVVTKYQATEDMELVNGYIVKKSTRDRKVFLNLRVNPNWDSYDLEQECTFPIDDAVIMDLIKNSRSLRFLVCNKRIVLIEVRIFDTGEWIRLPAQGYDPTKLYRPE